MPLMMLVSTRLPEHVLKRLRGAEPDLRLVAFDAESWPEAASSAEALLTWSLEPPEIELALARAPGITWVQSDFAGVGNLLIPPVLERDIALCNASGAHARPIAEWVLMLMLAFSKRVPALLDLKARRAWVDHRSDEIGGKTVGIVGPGQIGREVARLARAAGMRTLAVRRRAGGPQASAVEHIDTVYPRERLGDMAAEADFLVVTAPLTDETHGLIGRAALARLKPTAYLINVGRGPVVDEAALIEALRERRIAGAGLDVFETEPLPPESPFWTLDNVILSPHSCDHTPHTDDRVVDIILDNVRRRLAGEPLRNVVDKQAGY